uniref:Uncharacterized protein n=1 Tax=Culex tarsalis TaxID=7177 RepID=A0A1Q3F480_CULTA
MVCCVPGCYPAETSGDLVRVVKFPTEDGLRQRWLQAVEIGTGTALSADDDDADYQLCTGHFEWRNRDDCTESEQEYREPTVFGGGKVASCRLCHQFQPVGRMVPAVGGGKFVDMALDTLVALVLRITIKPNDFLRMVCDECLVKVDLIRSLQEQFAQQQDYYGGYLGKIKPKLEIEEVEWKQELIDVVEDDWRPESEEEDENEEESDEESSSDESEPEMKVEVVPRRRTTKRKAPVKRKKKEKKAKVKKGEPHKSNLVPRTCNICIKVFDSHSDLMVHLIGKHGSTEGFTCAECNDGHKFPTIQQYNYHMAYHDVSKRPLKCNFCPIRYRSEAALKRHENSKHGAKHKLQERVARECQCHECGKVFSAQWQLTQHARYNHRGVKARFECKVCKRNFSTALGLRTHILSSHAGHRPFQCESCDANYRTAADLKHHVMSVHEGKKPFRCGSCDISFRTKREYVNHRHNEHRNRRVYYSSCKLCPEIPQSNADLLAHIAACHADEEYPRVKCPHCPETFLTALSQGHHKRVAHKEYLPMECKICGKKYSTKISLNEHVNVVHLGKPATINRKSKPEPTSWTCPTCGKQFSSKQNMQRHEKAVHLGERNFQCDHCPKAFSTATVLQNHVRCVHTGEALHECPGCGQRFKENGTFYRHRAKCAPEASTKKAAAAK